MKPGGKLQLRGLLMALVLIAACAGPPKERAPTPAPG